MRVASPPPPLIENSSSSSENASPVPHDDGEVPVTVGGTEEVGLTAVEGVLAGADTHAATPRDATMSAVSLRTTEA